MTDNFKILIAIYGIGFILYLLFGRKLKAKYPPWVPVFANGFELGFLVAAIIFSII